MNQEELLKSLMELDFIAVDLGLFLNTHPDDSDAIAAYNQVITAADTVRMKYEETVGPLCSFRSYAANTQAYQSLWQIRSSRCCSHRPIPDA